MKNKRFLIIVGVLVAIIVGMSTGLFGQHENWPVGPTDKSEQVQKSK